ncbi:MAG: hypothetical protein GXP25_06840 [Planctomycetes bacterium]|nr:hypothetical protein [Planctomycetota bacterium]
MCAIQRTVLLATVISVLVSVPVAGQESPGKKPRKPAQTKKKQEGAKQRSESGLKKVVGGMLGFFGERMSELGESVESVFKGGTQLILDAVSGGPKKKQKGGAPQKTGTGKERAN